MYGYESFSRYYDLINFLNDNHIKKENIIQIMNFNSSGFALVYYVEE